MENIFTALADLALPRVCAVCGRKLHIGERLLCLECLSDLPETHFSTLEHNPMADKLNAGIEALRSPGDPFEAYSRATALFYYSPEDTYSLITQRLKYSRDFKLGREIGSVLGRRMAESPLWTDVDALVPVPLHRSRRWRRGYNQAEVICEALSGVLPRASVFPNVLKRVRRTRSQTVLGYEEKKLNVKGAFKVNVRETERMIGALGTEKPHIAIVDDVFTTGATISECHRALRLALGPNIRISAVTLACWQ